MSDAVPMIATILAVLFFVGLFVLVPLALFLYTVLKARKRDKEITELASGLGLKYSAPILDRIIFKLESKLEGRHRGRDLFVRWRRYKIGRCFTMFRLKYSSTSERGLEIRSSNVIISLLSRFSEDNRVDLGGMPFGEKISVFASDKEWAKRVLDPEMCRALAGIMGQKFQSLSVERGKLQLHYQEHINEKAMVLICMDTIAELARKVETA